MNVETPLSTEEKFFLCRDGETSGPYTLAKLSSMLDAGHIRLDSSFAREGENDWKPVAELIRQIAGKEPAGKSTPGSSPSAPPPPPTIKKPNANVLKMVGIGLIVGGVLLVVSALALYPSKSNAYNAGAASDRECMVLIAIGTAILGGIFFLCGCVVNAAVRIENAVRLKG